MSKNNDGNINFSKYPPGTVLFAGPDEKETEEDARSYIDLNKIDKGAIRLSRLTIELENGLTSKIIAVIKK